jgi:hypothetical protein
MADSKMPGPYLDSVPEEGSDRLMVYTNLKHMDIGARPSTLKTVDQSGPGQLDHVGKSAGRK